MPDLSPPTEADYAAAEGRSEEVSPPIDIKMIGGVVADLVKRVDELEEVIRHVRSNSDILDNYYPY